MGTQVRPINTDQYTQTLYEFDYYSGSQISIYFGNLLIDDIEAIQYSVSQSKRPVYGYASQYFHSVASGQIIVEGSFVIAFKEANYIVSALEYYSNHMRSAPIGENLELIDPKTGKGVTWVDRENVEEYIRRLDKDAKQSLPLDVMEMVAALPDNKWEDYAEAFEDALWKSDGPEKDFASGNAKGSQDMQQTKYRRADQFPPIDIWILYGDLESPSANHTIKKLIDVHIIGEGQSIQVGGENIHEQYRFFARNLA